MNICMNKRMSKRLHRSWFSKSMVLLICLGMLGFVLVGCQAGRDSNGSGSANQSGTNENQVWVYDIEMTIASENDLHIYSAKFPFYYYEMNPVEHKCEMKDFMTKPSKYISREDFNLFNDFITEKANEPKPDNGVFAYSITLSYYDEDSKQQTYYFEGYDEFPEELNALIDKYNELCGETIFVYPDKLTRLTPDFFYEEMGVSEDEYPRQAVSDMINGSSLSFERFTSKPHDAAGYMANYFHFQEKETVEDIWTTELRPAVEVSDEEFDTFVNRFAEELGSQWTVSDSSDQIGLIKFVNMDTNQSMYVGKATVLDSYEVEAYGDEVCIYLDAHMEDMTIKTEFIYNQAGTYILVDFEACTDFSIIANKFYYLQ